MSNRSLRREAAPGQIIVLFVLSLTAIFAMAALLFDGAHALVLRRQLQNAGDTAALQAANLLQSLKGCSATYVSGSAPGSPRSEVTATAIAAVQAAIPGTPAGSIRVSCPADSANYVVEVDVTGHSPTFFGGAVGVRGFDVSTTSQAVNGPVAPPPYSVLVLDNQTSGTACPSTLISGGPTIIFEGSAVLDSACPSSGGGGLGTNGNSASLTFNNSAVIKIQGAYVPGTLRISPTPLSGQPYVKDPLATYLPAMSTYIGSVPGVNGSLPLRSSVRLVLGASDTLLQPGVYIGGIQLKNSVKAFLQPGIYVMYGGGFDIGAQNAVYSVAAGVTSTSDATWSTDCPDTTCGVLLYNTNWSGSRDQITVGAGATLKLKPYKAGADTTSAKVKEYENLLMWQNGSPAPPSTSQPVVALSGGGAVDISGTVYAPGAQVYMTGGSGGSGGGTDVTLQFICWDLQIQGNSSFHFFYNNQKFVTPPDYGLIK